MKKIFPICMALLLAGGGAALAQGVKNVLGKHDTDAPISINVVHCLGRKIHRAGGIRSRSQIAANRCVQALQPSCPMRNSQRPNLRGSSDACV